MGFSFHSSFAVDVRWVFLVNLCGQGGTESVFPMASVSAVGEVSMAGAGGWEEQGLAGASEPAERVCSYVMPVLLAREDKEESRTKAVPTVAMAVSKPPR